MTTTAPASTGATSLPSWALTDEDIAYAARTPTSPVRVAELRDWAHDVITAPTADVAAAFGVPADCAATTQATLARTLAAEAAA